MKIAALCHPSAYSLAHLKEFASRLASKDCLVIVFFLALSFLTLAAEWASLRRKKEPYYYLRQELVLLGMAAAIVLLTPGLANDFIYFAF